MGQGIGTVNYPKVFVNVAYEGRIGDTKAGSHVLNVGGVIRACIFFFVDALYCCSELWLSIACNAASLLFHIGSVVDIAILADIAHISTQQ